MASKKGRKRYPARVVRRGDALYAVMPRALLEKLGYRAGTRVKVEARGGAVVITKAKRFKSRGRTGKEWR